MQVSLCLYVCMNESVKLYKCLCFCVYVRVCTSSVVVCVFDYVLLCFWACLHVCS